MTLLCFEVVLASGTVLVASTAENSDLSRSLNGVNNSVVVTRHDLATFGMPAGSQMPLRSGSAYCFP